MEGAVQRRRGDQVAPGTWSWLKEWSGYIVTLLPYVSAMLVLIPSLSVPIKFVILGLFAAFVLTVRVIHEKAGLEVTGEPQKQKRPGGNPK